MYISRYLLIALFVAFAYSEAMNGPKKMMENGPCQCPDGSGMGEGYLQSCPDHVNFCGYIPGTNYACCRLLIG